MPVLGILIQQGYGRTGASLQGFLICGEAGRAGVICGELKKRRVKGKLISIYKLQSVKKKHLDSSHSYPLRRLEAMCIM